LILATLAALWPLTAAADTLKIAWMDTGLTRKGPGLMLRALTDRPDDQALAAVAVLAAADADILVLGGFDHDYGLHGLRALRDRLAEAGRDYPHMAAISSMSGKASGVDVDGDGRLNEPEDAMGYGWFSGENGIAVLSRLPLGAIEDLGAVLWADVPGSAARDVLSPAAAAVIPLASTAHWRVPVTAPGGTFDLLAMAATPPVFDGPEDRNGLRNRDQLQFWAHKLSAGDFTAPILAGRFNLDPVDGEGYRPALLALLDHPRLQDPAPTSTGAAQFQSTIPNAGPPAQDTAAWAKAPGALRVDYILPSRDWRVLDSGVLWPAPDDPFAETVAQAGADRLVWVDITR
jgi:hypothetical protein